LTALTPVVVPCRYGHHDSHTVSIAPVLGIDGGIRAEQALFASKGDADELTRLWLPIFVRYGAKDWDLCDESGDPAPFDVETLLDDYTLARPVADKAGDLYKDAVLSPFLARQQTRSPTGPTRATTSRRRRQTP
jgi:hypothetical protein